MVVKTSWDSFADYLFAESNSRKKDQQRASVTSGGGHEV
jgi:hypothetical protein